MSRLKFSLILIAWGIILSVSVVFYVLKHDPSRLTNFVVSQVTNNDSGLSLTLDQAQIQIFPQLKITLHHVLLRHEPSWQVLAPQAELRPSFNIIHGKLDLHLQNPIIRIKTSSDAPNPTAKGAKIPEAAKIPTAKVAEAIKAEAIEAEAIEAEAIEAEAVEAEAIEAEAVEAIAKTEAKNSQDAIPSQPVDLPALAMQALANWPKDSSLSLDQGQMLWLHDNVEIFRVLDLSFQASLDPASNYVQAKGRFLWENQDIPLNLHADFNLHPEFLDLKRLSLDLDGNRLDLQGQANLLTQQLQAKVDVAQLSLPRWLNFARQLPPGLTWALHQISGQAQLSLDKQALKLTSLTARMANMTAKGELKFTWSPLKLEITAHTPEALLNNLFPELLKQNSPVLKLPPPLPLPEATSTPDLDYDLKFSGDEVHAWKLMGRAGQVQILPSTPIIQATSIVQVSPSNPAQTRPVDLGKTTSAKQTAKSTSIKPILAKPALAEKGTQLKIKLQLAEGQVEAQLNFPKATSHMDLALDVDQIRLEKLLKPFTTTKANKPSLAGLGQLSFKGQATLHANFLAFMSSLKGNLDYDFRQGYLQLQEKYDFTKLSGQFVGQGQSYNAKQITYTGSSSLNFEQADQSFSLNFTGPLKLSTQTWLLQAAEGHLSNLHFNLPQLKGQAKATLNLDLTKSSVNLQNLSLDFSNTGAYASHVRGNFNINFADAEPYLSSSWKLHTSQPKTLASLVNLDLNWLAADSCQQFNAQGQFKGTTQNFKISNLHGQLDATSFEGQLNYAQNTWQGNLHLGNLNLDTYLPPKSPKDAEPSPWPVEKLKAVDLDIFLFIQRLSLAKISLTQAELPLKLKQGNLTLPWQGQFYGGQLNGSCILQPQGAGVWSEFKLSAKRVQMLQLTQQWATETLVAGLARCEIDHQGLIYNTADFPKALNGTWEFDLNNGYIAKNHANNAPKTKINLLSATGNLHQGILSSKNLYFNGGGYSVKGQGQVDLLNWQLYYNLLLTGYGLNNLPLTYSGSLGSPTTNIKLLDLFSGLFSGIGKGVFGLLEKTLKAPLQLF